MRSGFTLIETLVALVLLEVGMLALAATSAVAARDLTFAHRSVRAQTLARNRVELLWASACSAPGSGQASVAGFAESWRVDTEGERRRITTSVDFAVPGGRQRQVVMDAAAICIP